MALKSRILFAKVISRMSGAKSHLVLLLDIIPPGVVLLYYVLVPLTRSELYHGRFYTPWGWWILFNLLHDPVVRFIFFLRNLSIIWKASVRSSTPPVCTRRDIMPKKTTNNTSTIPALGFTCLNPEGRHEVE
jgi:hypothetical protein